MKLKILATTLVSSAAACPGSPSFMHAKCDMSVVFQNSCPEVVAEITGRVSSADWSDPHNGGTYTITASSDTSIAGQRVTGDKKYTDKFDFILTAGDGTCTVEACSESQVSSLIDYSTNYCNLHSLYCNSADDCTTVGTELTYAESYSSCSQHDNVCVVKALHSPMMQAKDDEPCCNSCLVEGEEKYFSVDTRADLCGESCMTPSDFPKYKIFEKGLEKADKDNMCESLGYPVYTETEVHGFGPIKATVDMYAHDSKSYKLMNEVECVAPTVECVYNDAGDSQCCTQGEFCVPGVGCRC